MYKLKCPTLFRSPPISSFVTTSKWMPLPSYSPQKDCRQIGRCSHVPLISTPPTPRCPQIHTLYTFISSRPPTPVIAKTLGWKVKGFLSGCGWTHTHLQTTFPSIRLQNFTLYRTTVPCSIKCDKAKGISASTK
jgi:hypothetical protein